MLIDELREESVSGVVAYAEFAESFNKNSTESMYCFFEGDDDYDYYRARIHSHAKQKIILDFNCGGKDYLLKAYSLIKDKPVYANATTAYFIDQDFDCYINNPDIYITPCYSIENFYSDVESFKSILKSRFKIPRDSNDMEICLQLYLNTIDKFHDKVLFLNSWLSCYADLRNQGVVNKRLFIEKKTKKLFDDIVHVNVEDVKDFTEFNNFLSLKALFDNNEDVKEEVFLKKVEQYKYVDKSKVFRGKFELRFLISFLKRLNELIGNKAKTICSKAYASTMPFNEPYLTLLSGFAITPPCLIDYLRRIDEPSN
ncbi:DUF4435 domain-containing protein [Rufibacter glacialis]|uniref:DUF4435 domain-containing protein n=1 Tax=Rufibacter glacialis TaxID=1259555 RepID=A0A5M8QK83_9BACT|nr:DUF4435 domain-containing protein [Rufibacter glacialis]KAA6434712.1 DUF4435 domain-containing protein [Rufibacter glacialis]GGK71815.1 hypothetical protein GCM10011405_20040 [Rufibacter glacialis]